MLDKFSESFWRWTFYFTAHVVSVYTLLGKPWVWNTFDCWYGYPNHVIGEKVGLNYITHTSANTPVQIVQFGGTTC